MFKSVACVLALALCVPMMSCGANSPSLSTVASDAIDCAKQQDQTLISSLGPSVLGLLAGTLPNWEASLGTLVASLGSAAECAIKEVVTQETAVTGMTGSAAVGKAFAVPAVIANGNAFMAKHKMRFVTVDSEVPPNLK